MKILVTIPAFNEAKTLPRVIQGIKKVMKKYDYKILVVDDGSKDKTKELAKKNGAIVISHPKNYGLAETFKTEMKESLKHDPDIIVHIDADGQYLAEDIPKLIEEIKKGNDLVLGSRFKGKIETMPFLKRLGNKAFSRVISQIIGMKITDSQTGFRAFTKKIAEIPLTSDHTYTQEQIIRAAREKYRIKEVPVYFAKRTYGRSRLMKNPVDYAIKAWINLLRIYRDYKPLKFFGAVGTVLMMFGFLIGLYLVYLHFTTGIVGHVPLMVLCLMLLIMGLQISMFGFLADMRK